MQKILLFKRVLAIQCLLEHYKQPSQFIYEFAIKLENKHPHNILKYTIRKYKKQIIHLYKHLQIVIYDFNIAQEYFKSKFAQQFNFKEDPHHFIQEINLFLYQCLDRCDVILNKEFLEFFGVEMHFDDFMQCIDNQNIMFLGESSNASHLIIKEEVHNKKQQSLYCTERPWLKNKSQFHIQSKQQSKHIEVKEEKDIQRKEYKEIQKQNKSQIPLNKLLRLLSLENGYKLQIKSNKIINFDNLSLNQEEDLFFVIQQYTKNSKCKPHFILFLVTSILKSFLNKQQKCGLISIYKRHAKKIQKKYSYELEAEPFDIKFYRKSSILVVTTNIGVYIFCSKLDKHFEELEILGFIELPGVFGFAYNEAQAEIYIIRKSPKDSSEQLYLYSINRELLIKCDFKYQHLSSIYYEETTCRIFVSDQKGISIYKFVTDLELVLVSIIKTENDVYKKMIKFSDYLLAMNSKGYVTILELKCKNKEQLISIVTNIDIPCEAKNVIIPTSNKTLLLSCFNNCLILVDTIHGPLYSIKLMYGDYITNFTYLEAQKCIVTISSDGWVSYYQISPLI